jgi:hypothetical protein
MFTHSRRWERFVGVGAVVEGERGPAIAFGDCEPCTEREGDGDRSAQEDFVVSGSAGGGQGGVPPSPVGLFDHAGEGVLVLGQTWGQAVSC